MSTRKRNRKPPETEPRPLPAYKTIEVDDLEYWALRRFYELDRAGENAGELEGETWPVKQAEKWMRDMQLLREAIALLDMRKLPKPQDRGLINGIRIVV
jgi:hypothetical protein